MRLLIARRSVWDFRAFIYCGLNALSNSKTTKTPLMNKDDDYQMRERRVDCKRLGKVAEASSSSRNKKTQVVGWLGLFPHKETVTSIVENSHAWDGNSTMRKTEVLALT